MLKLNISIVDYCQQFPDIIAAYLFGSRACSAAHSDSDLDIALLLAEGSTEFDLLGFIVGLEKHVGLPVDAVVLNRAGEVLKYEVRRHGVLLYERDRAQRIRFEVMGRKYYEDFRYLHQRYAGKVLYGEHDG